MSLYRYATEARGIADDLLELLTFEEAEAIRALFQREGYDPLVNIPPKDAKAVFVFLGKAPAAQSRQLEKLTGEAKLLFWLRARYLALASANALRLAEFAETRIGSKYRDAVRSIAQELHPYPEIPSIEHLLGPKWA